jgi:hypothetical protein
MTTTAVSLLRAQAQWAYGEITDGTLAHIYDNTPNVDALRARYPSGVPFNQLTADEHYNLAFLCMMCRTNLMIFATGVIEFVEVALNKTQVATFLVPQMVSDHAGMISFADFLSTTAVSPKDARNVLAPQQGHRAQPAPLTVGHFFNSLVLLDGYHRAASFWKFAPADAMIQAYIPAQFVSAS